MCIRDSDDIVACMYEIDARRAAAEETERAAAEAAQRAREEEEARKRTQEEVVEAEADKSDEELSQILLDLLQSHGRADADAMRQCLGGRCARLDAVVQELKANFLIFELEPGLYGLL